jgi:hypothetical protein
VNDHINCYGVIILKSLNLRFGEDFDATSGLEKAQLNMVVIGHIDSLVVFFFPKLWSFDLLAWRQ